MKRSRELGEEMIWHFFHGTLEAFSIVKLPARVVES